MYNFLVRQIKNRIPRISPTELIALRSGNTSLDRGILKGVIKFPDGSTYAGQTSNKQFNGKGRMTHANGDIYHGEWLNGRANG